MPKRCRPVCRRVDGQFVKCNTVKRRRRAKQHGFQVCIQRPMIAKRRVKRMKRRTRK